MPLLHRKSFVKKKPPKNLKPNDKVFFCELTEEVFIDYDEFWERLVLLNALVWTCELTGRPNMTYQEALESENKARRCISNVSVALKKPLLYISTYTKRGRIGDASDDIFTYIRDRYFVGEVVEAIVSNHWYDCKVTKVIMPTKQEIIAYEQSMEDSDEEPEDSSDDEPVILNGNDDDDDIVILRDDHEKNKTPQIKNKKKESKSAPPPKEEEKEYPPFPTVKYEVIEIEPWDYKESKHHVVKWDQIRRAKSAFTREKCKMFVKQCLRLCPEGYYTLKDSLVDKLGIKQMKYDDIFVGEPPKFEVTKLKKIPFFEKVVKKKKKKSSKQSEERKEDLRKEDGKKKVKNVLTEEAKEKARKLQLAMKEKSKEEWRRKLDSMKIERKRKKDLEREETRLMRIYEYNWWQKKEDLECEDHKDLPATTSLQTRIPIDFFGDFLMVLDFVNTFADILELGDVYPRGITFEMLEQALNEKEVAGVFNDVIQLLLGAIFSLQEEEYEEIKGEAAMDTTSMNLEEHLESKTQIAAVNIANKASSWSQQYHGVSLQKAPFDALTVTEILRIHILASGASNVANNAWRHMNRGGYKYTDDPGLMFKLEEPEIMKKLSTESLFDLNLDEKIKIMNLLVSQIMTYASVRDNIEEKQEKLKELSSNYRLYKMAAARKEKEEMIAKKQKLKDLKMKMEKNLLEQRLQAAQAEANGEAPKENASADTPNGVTKANIIEMEELIEEEVEKETRATLKKRDETVKKKVQVGKQERDFINQIESLCQDVKQFQLGQDRAFRRYWVFNLIPGLFVEDRNTNLGCCLDHPTPVHPVIFPSDNKELKELIKKQAKENLEIMEKEEKEKEYEKNSSDKENESGETPTKNGMKTPIAKNFLKAPNNNIVSQEVIVLDEDENENETNKLEIEDEIVDLVSLPPKLPSDLDNIQELHSKIFGLCSGDVSTCPAHCEMHSRSRWSYYSDPEDLEKLIDSLNVRGVRESELKENLILNKDKILASMGEVSTFRYDYSGKEETPVDLKKALKRNLNFPVGTPIDRILELTLRDMILESEEKIDNGMLGVLKVPERDVWRQAIVDGTSLSFANPQDLDVGGKKRINQFKSSIGMDITEDDFADIEELVSKDGLCEAGIVKELAIALLQVAQALDHKYLKAPMAEPEKMGKKRRKLEERLRNNFRKTKKDVEVNEESSDEEETQEGKKTFEIPSNVDNSLRTPFERWEKSLMSCTSFSQVFLHLATFDSSVTWKRSAVVHKRCRICRRSNESEIMLLCDKCDGGYHMFCLKPKLTSVPEGDWFCDKCKPKVKSKSPKKTRQIYKEEIEEVVEVENQEDDVEEEEEEEEVVEEEEEPEITNQEYCSACETGGELVCCDTCPRSFHIFCADLRKVPRGVWSCPLCRENRTKAKATKSKSKLKKKLKTDQEIENTLRRSSKPAKEESSRRGVKRVLEEEDVVEEFHKDAVEKILEKLSNHKNSIPFRKPILKNECPDYYAKIKKPIDLRTIKLRFNKGKYSTDAEFIADVMLIFQNTQQYFKEGDSEYTSGMKLSKMFFSEVKARNMHSAGLIEDSGVRPSKKRRQC